MPKDALCGFCSVRRNLRSAARSPVSIPDAEDDGSCFRLFFSSVGGGV